MNKKNEKKNNLAMKALAVMLAMGVWQLAAMAVDTEILLASPLQVFLRLCTIWQEPGFWSTICFSMGRIAAGFLLAVFSGILLGIVAGRFPLAEILLQPYVVVMKTVPAASFIILALIWFNLARMAIFVSFLIAFPVIYSNVVSGIRGADPKLLEMAHLYQVPLRKKLRCIYLPALRPYLMTSLSVAMGMAWKAGIAAEVIGIVDGSIGERLYEAKVYFQSADLLAWTFLLVLLSLLMENMTTGRFFCHEKTQQTLKNQQSAAKNVTEGRFFCHKKNQEMLKNQGNQGENMTKEPSHCHKINQEMLKNQGNQGKNMTKEPSPCQKI